LLTLPGSAFPSQNWMGMVHFDKVVHIGLFSLLTLLICHGLYKTQLAGRMVRDTQVATRGVLIRAFIITAVAVLFYGIIIEYVQRDFIPNRSFDSGDILADGVGAAAGALLSRYRFIKK
jgi:VanZ family protein